jgi:hypothetical protein
MFEWMSKKTIIRTILAIVIISCVLRWFSIGELSDTLLLGMIAHSIALIGLKDWRESKECTENKDEGAEK